MVTVGIWRRYMSMRARSMALTGEHMGRTTLRERPSRGAGRL